MTSTTAVKVAQDTGPDLVPVRDHNALQTLRDAADAGLFAFCTVFSPGVRSYTIFTDDGTWAFGERLTDDEESRFVSRLGTEEFPSDYEAARKLVHRDYDIVAKLESCDPMILLGFTPRSRPTTVYGSQFPADWRV